MKLQTKLVLSFSLILAMTLGLGVTDYYLTDKMGLFSKQAAYIDNSKAALLHTQAAYLRFIVYGDDNYAERSQQELEEARKLLETCFPMLTNPENKEKMTNCIKQLQAIGPVLRQLVENQRKSKMLLAQTEEPFMALEKSFKAFDAGIREILRNQGAEQRSLDNHAKFMELRMEVNRLRTAINNLSLSSPQDVFAAVLMHLKEMRDAMIALRDHFQLPTGKADMAAISKDVDTYCTKAQAYVELISQMGTHLKSMITLFREVEAGITELSVFSVKQVQEGNDRANVVSIAVCAMVLFCGIAITLLLSRNVANLLGKDPGELNIIAHRVVDGDYNVDDGGRKQGVYAAIVEMVGALETNIKKAELESKNAREATDKAEEAMKKAESASREAQAKTEALLNVADRLGDMGSVLSSASAELSAQIEQSDRGAAESAQRLSESATAMNEMNATVQEVARNAASASTASSETKEKAVAGAQVVKKSVRSIDEVHKMSLALKEDMARLNEHARSIDQIMGVISDIADQTNLLALNAAIEAARAGEAGRGFAVVADEVRKLAEKTMSSTNDVGNAIKAIQESTAKSMESVDHAVEQIAEATELASESGRALEEIVAMADVTADQVRAIATASEEQSAASEEINQSILRCNDMSGQIASAAAEAAKAVADLAQEAQNLSQLIDEMKRV